MARRNPLVPSRADSPAFTAESRLVVVDVSEKPAKANIVREGLPVPPPRVDLDRVRTLLGGLKTIPSTGTPRVLAQSIPAGTKVARGSSVDLVLAPRSKIPFNVFELPHKDLKDRTLEQVESVLANPKIRQLLATRESSESLSNDEQALITNELRDKASVNVDASDDESSFDRAFHSLRNAMAFG